MDSGAQPGMGGTGKTTLAKSIYEHPHIIPRFDILAWATISEQFNVLEILSQLLFGQGHSYDTNTSVEELGLELHKTLTSRRYLIILDDIWSVEAWDEVVRFFPKNGNRSRVVLTTRLSNVASMCGSSCFTMNPLDEDQSWRLFCKKAFQHKDCLYPELEKIGKEIVKSCKGLPLSIVVIGGSLLKSPKTVRYWKNVAKDIESGPNSKEKQESLDVLFSSYNNLPSHLKPCFLHIGVYKSGYSDINVSKIVKLWVAEGILKPNGCRVLEEIAEDYLKDLVDRNLILVGRRSKNGKLKCCDIHDLLRDLCLKVAEQQEFFHVIRDGRVQGTERRLIYTTSTKKGTGISGPPPLTRSIMTHEFHKQKLDKHTLLRILKVRRHTSAEESFGCVNLRYLALQSPPKDWGSERVWELPTSVSLVWNLHTLIFGKSWSHCKVVAPIEIWKMRQLRHIKCPQIYLPHPSVSDQQDDLLILENFQTLKTVGNFRLSEEVCKIIPNIKKLSLIYDSGFHGHGDSLIECLCYLDRLHKLESLKLKARSKQDTKQLNKILDSHIFQFSKQAVLG